MQLAHGANVKFQGRVVQESRKLKDYLIARTKPKGIDVLCGLQPHSTNDIEKGLVAEFAMQHIIAIYNKYNKNKPGK